MAPAPASATRLAAESRPSYVAATRPRTASGTLRWSRPSSATTLMPSPQPATAAPATASARLGATPTSARPAARATSPAPTARRVAQSAHGGTRDGRAQQIAGAERADEQADAEPAGRVVT